MTGFKGSVDHDEVLFGLKGMNPFWLVTNAPAIKLHIEQLAADNTRLREKTRDAIARREVGLKALRSIHNIADGSGPLSRMPEIAALAYDAITKIEYHE